MLETPEKITKIEEKLQNDSTSNTTPPAQSTGTRVIYQQPKQTPYWIFFACIVVLVAVLSYGVGAMMTLSPRTSSTGSDSSSSGSGMNMNMGSSSSSDTSNVPNATQDVGNQLATYTIDKDGAKHFTLTASQVMWNVQGGHRVLAWAINGTVPGPMLRVNSGDHVRVTFINHFPKATAVHWHGLEVPTIQDGVAGIGQPPIKPRATYLYDFTVSDNDIGSHWYHSHYDDLEQVTNGFYGAFVVDPKPGTPAAAKQIHADVEYTTFIGAMGGYYVMNGKAYPDTQPLNVQHGQTVHMRIYGADTLNMHPMHLHGHTMTVVAEDGHMLTQPIQKDTIQVAPGESYDVTFQAWAAPGSVYPFHCHILSHLMNPDQKGEEMGGLIIAVIYKK